MSAILLPRWFLSQPQYPAQIDYGGLGKGIQLLFNPAVGPVDLATGRVWTPGGNASVTTEQKGKVFSFDGIDDYYAHTGYPEIEGNVGTFFMWCPVVGPSDGSGHVFFGHSSPTVRGHQIFPDLRIAYASTNAAPGSLLPPWFNSTNRSLVMTCGGTAATTKVYLDGMDSGVFWSSTPGAWGTGNKNLNFGRYVGGTAWDFNGTILVVGYASVTWGEAEARAFHQNPWLLLKAPRRMLPVPSSGGGGEVSGSVTYTNADDASSANAAPIVTASSATTNSDDVSDAVAEAESETVIATVNVTNADDASAASATPIIVGSSGTTNAADISVANATATVTASAANTNADDISAASAASGSDAEGSVAYTNIDDVSNAVAVPTVTASSANVNAGDSSSATLKATITASVAFTNSNDISSAFSGAVVSGSVAVTNADDVSAAAASPVVSGSSATTNADDISDAAAEAEAGEVIASVAVTNANDISAAVAAPVIVGSVAYSNLHDLSAAIAVINFGTIIEAALTTGIVQDTRIKKPGIPSDAPEWQRIMFEILTGRRGNKITVAPHQTLTFSATPTQAECEALYSYVSEVRRSIDQLTKRFDS